jgi:putative endopeptidase
MKKLSLLALPALVILAFTFIKTTNPGNTNKVFIDSANFDFSVRPGDNFYLYANGNWLKNNPIPASESRWGSFSEIQEFNYKALHELLDGLASAKPAAGSKEQKVRDLYLSGMDTVDIEAKGYSALKPDLDRIAKLKNSTDVINEICYQHSLGDNPVFAFYAAQDDKNSAAIVPQVYQGGLGLPDRDYYFKDDERSLKIREGYLSHVKKMFMLVGDNDADAQKNANDVMNLEMMLAQASYTRVKLRDPESNYHKMSLADLEKQTPLMHWKDMMQKMMVTGWDTIIVGQPEFFVEVNNQLTAASIDTWKAYFRWHAIHGSAPFMSSAFVNESFDFYGKTLSGQKENKPRWKRVLNTVDGGLGELLGEMYVNKHFKPEAKTRMLALVKNLQYTYAERIKRLDWMSKETKDKALSKLNAFMLKIGYPDKWIDYSTVKINRNSYYSNLQQIGKFEYKRMINKLGKPVDKTEWGMTPPTVNAYYNPGFNEIVFPAGILHFPFFEFSADDAINYGGIGAVIGHEMTHGFDDQGSQYDATGNLKNWWSDADAEKFKEKTHMVVDQYNNYTVLNDVHVNGELTLGENLADLGGINIAYEAFKKTPQGMSNEKINGFTPDQRFFLSWAQVWRNNITDQALMLRINTDPHSPGIYRCNGPISNMPEFYAAFGIKEGDPMWKPESQRAKVW